MIIAGRDVVRLGDGWIGRHHDSHDSTEKFLNVLGVVVRICLLATVSGGPVEVVPVFLLSRSHRRSTPKDVRPHIKQQCRYLVLGLRVFLTRVFRKKEPEQFSCTPTMSFFICVCTLSMHRKTSFYPSKRERIGYHSVSLGAERKQRARDLSALSHVTYPLSVCGRLETNPTTGVNVAVFLSGLKKDLLGLPGVLLVSFVVDEP